ncbi:bifunctional RecB family nuclease/DEAD/DEAH box helicase [Microbacterium sp. cx-59]|uniref:TM0106 family RecB-like putative nuclease n=1 Tax=Microbacterium sp. cx-59 TaxID=2891207 RepID=UPI001E43D024|nr:bifunctional RecB family nuclease/DEAD/DEAH box helicase [Microbacterium sp. cx-59]MCC4909153.1 TM0106 family RecB-like putative nuclease [Microbacterium sp. cx-59]
MRYIEPQEGEPGRIVWSASDLKAAAECEFAWSRQIDARLGRIAAVPDPEDLMLERAARLGTRHEEDALARYRAEQGDAVAEIAETRSGDAEGMTAAVAATIAALTDPSVRVIYQAAFRTDDFVGFADFLVRSHDGSWIVQDTKLARHARVTALMQLAAYAEQLDRLGVPRSDRVELLLGDGSVSVHRVTDLAPVYALRRRRLAALVADRDLAAGAAGNPLAWGDDRGDLQIVACGRCATCEQEVVAARDLLLVAGMRPVQRERLRRAGITTIDALAAAGDDAAPARMSADVFASLQTQARLQLDSPAGVPSGEVAPPEARPAVPRYEVVLPQALGALPRRDPGDLFFDFEGDPLYTEGASGEWGIDYLFGWIDTREQYTALWAHSFAEERTAFETFVDVIELRRRQHPGMHIYHYAPYEPTHLLAMAAKYGTREAEIDRMLRDGLFVDLYPVVRRALRVGSRSYSIKKLEPLYMGDALRTSEVQRGDDSIVRYVEARVLRDAGDRDAAAAIFADLAEYNRDDCVSTLRLRDWLVDRARDAGLMPSGDPSVGEFVYEASPRAVALGRAADAAAEVVTAAGADPTTDDDVVALRLAAAAIDYYPREAKTFWASHFLRLREPVSLWEDTRDVVVVDAERSHLLEDWHTGEGRARSLRRRLELRGDLAPGTRLSAGGQPFVLYPLPAPFPTVPSPRWIHVARTVRVVEVLEDGAIVEELASDGETWAELPFALTPSAPPSAGNQQTAIDAWADRVIDAAPTFPEDPATDILRRLPPRTGSHRLDAAGGALDDITAITRSIRALERSYLAVQGPPGTGKTYVGSHVIARLVHEHGYRVGVVAQSHAVIEHMLDRVVAAGVPKHLVGKALKDPDAAATVSFTAIEKNGVAAFTEGRPGGFVIGGTAWDFSHSNRVPRGSLDLLVIDEAGQFSLASTIAVSVAATRLLLLGDPQQLPQVSQGTHPEPVDTSALGWVMRGAAVLPREYGTFLSRSWRMHPEVARPVSLLSYAGELASAPPTALRNLEGVVPGVHAVPVRHRGNAVASPEEAAEVVRLVRATLGRTWTPSDEIDGVVTELPSRPVTADDIIVVTPYNAQQGEVEAALEAAGIPGVRVGTVDRFQGQEAVVAIVTLAASSGRDAPRGLEFLLLQNRLNVAVSRAQFAAYVVYSPGLLDDLPRTPDGVTRLSAFARLVGEGV